MRSEKITFAGSQGEPLAARLDLPDGAVRAGALFAHCFTCSKDTLAAARIAGALAEKGIAVLRFDFTGLGGSGGDFANTDFSSNIADHAGPNVPSRPNRLSGAALSLVSLKISAPEMQAHRRVHQPAP